MRGACRRSVWYSGSIVNDPSKSGSAANYKLRQAEDSFNKRLKNYGESMDNYRRLDAENRKFVSQKNAEQRKLDKKRATQKLSET